MRHRGVNVMPANAEIFVCHIGAGVYRFSVALVVVPLAGDGSGGWPWCTCRGGNYKSNLRRLGLVKGEQTGRARRGSGGEQEFRRRDVSSERGPGWAVEYVV